MEPREHTQTHLFSSSEPLLALNQCHLSSFSLSGVEYLSVLTDLVKRYSFSAWPTWGPVDSAAAKVTLLWHYNYFTIELPNASVHSEGVPNLSPGPHGAKSADAAINIRPMSWIPPCPVTPVYRWDMTYFRSRRCAPTFPDTSQLNGLRRDALFLQLESK